MSTTITTPEVTAKAKPWPLFRWGVLLFFTGILLYIGQIYLKQLFTPWYLPILATAGLFLMFVAVSRRPGRLAILGLVVFTLLTGAQWFFIGFMSKLPEYRGPAQAGAKLPGFSATLADGSQITDQYLRQGAPTVLVFFRGRW